MNAVLFDKNYIKCETSVVWLFEVKLLINSYSFCITNIDRLILIFFGCLWILWKISINIPWLSEYTVESLFRSLVENLFWPTLQNVVRQYVFIGICSNEIHVHTKNIINMQLMSIMFFIHKPHRNDLLHMKEDKQLVEFGEFNYILIYYAYSILALRRTFWAYDIDDAIHDPISTLFVHFKWQNKRKQSGFLNGSIARWLFEIKIKKISKLNKNSFLSCAKISAKKLYLN